MWSFIDPFSKYENERKPKITPQHAKPPDHITAPYMTKEGNNKNKRKDQ